MPETPVEKLRKANDDYHEAIDEILSNGISVETKAQIGDIANKIFDHMKDIDKLVEAAYAEE